MPFRKCPPFAKPERTVLLLSTISSFLFFLSLQTRDAGRMPASLVCTVIFFCSFDVLKHYGGKEANNNILLRNGQSISLNEFRPPILTIPPLPHTHLLHVQEKMILSRSLKRKKPCSRFPHANAFCTSVHICSRRLRDAEIRHGKYTIARLVFSLTPPHIRPTPALGGKTESPSHHTAFRTPLLQSGIKGARPSDRRFPCLNIAIAAAGFSPIISSVSLQSLSYQKKHKRRNRLARRRNSSTHSRIPLRSARNPNLWITGIRVTPVYERRLIRLPFPVRRTKKTNAVIYCAPNNAKCLKSQVFPAFCVVQALGFRAMVRKIFFPRRIAHHAMQCGCAWIHDRISLKTVMKIRLQ